MTTRIGVDLGGTKIEAVVVNIAGDAPTVLAKKRVPTERDRYSVGFRLAKRLTVPWNATLRLEERLYADTWNMFASSTDARYMVDASRFIRLWPHFRFHVQNGASFYKLAGLDVNLRGVSFKDVKVSTETVEGKPVLVIEGVIVGETRKPVELPRLRFSVRDAQGSEIYAWNTVLDQTTLQPGERALFKSRLASPPAEGKSIDIRFFNKQDVAGGSI